MQKAVQHVPKASEVKKKLKRGKKFVDKNALYNPEMLLNKLSQEEKKSRRNLWIVKGGGRRNWRNRRQSGLRISAVQKAA